MSAHLAIQAAIVAALNAAPALASGNIKANPVRPTASSQSQAIVVRLMQSRSATPQLLSGPYDWVTTYQVECLARAANASAEPASTVDSLLSAAWERLAGISAQSLGALDVRMNPAIDWTYDDADTPIVSATVSLQVIHRTPSTNLNAWS